MKLSKVLALIPLIVLIFEIILLPQKTSTKIQPVNTDKTEIYREIQETLIKNDLKPIQFEIFDYRNEAEFYIKDKTMTKVIIPANIPPILLASILQKVIKKANIEGKGISYIDLSTAHPYATFKDN